MRTARRFNRWPLALPLALGALAIATTLLIAFRAGVFGRTSDPTEPVPATAAAELPLAAGECEIVSVEDGRTLLVRQRPSPAKQPALFRVRLLGVRLAGPSAEHTEATIAEAAKRELISLARPGIAAIELDKRRVSHDEAWLAYVTVDGMLLNAELIRSGWATYDLYPGDSFPQGRVLTTAEKDARQEGRGIWRRVEEKH